MYICNLETEIKQLTKEEKKTFLRKEIKANKLRRIRKRPLGKLYASYPIKGNKDEEVEVEVAEPLFLSLSLFLSEFNHSLTKTSFSRRKRSLHSDHILTIFL